MAVPSPFIRSSIMLCKVITLPNLSAVTFNMISYLVLDNLVFNLCKGILYKSQKKQLNRVFFFKMCSLVFVCVSYDFL